MKPINNQTRDTIATMVQDGIPTRTIANTLKLSVGVISKYKNMDPPTLSSCLPGRKSIFLSKEKSLLKRKFLTGSLRAGKEAFNYLLTNGKQVSYVATLNVLKELGFEAKIKVKKSCLSNKHKKTRFEWAKVHQNWTIDNWKRVIWSDKIKINLWNSNGIKYYWKRKQDKIQDFHLELTVKHGDENLMMWDCMAYYGAGYACQIYSDSINWPDVFHFMIFY